MVVDRNPYETPAAELHGIKVLEVFLNGQPGFGALPGPG
ncbi:MAG: hypothetical protein KDI17_00545 [Halioglobus sp.]|nr:hypothetical protein [Halioglobus sp.]